MIKRRQLLKSAGATAAMVGSLPLALGAELADSPSDANSVHWQKVKLKKGETIFYVDPVSRQRQQVMAVTDTIQVNVPRTQLSLLPAGPRKLITRKLPL